MSCRNCPGKIRERHSGQRHLDVQRPRTGEEQGHREAVPAALAESRQPWRGQRELRPKGSTCPTSPCLCFCREPLRTCNQGVTWPRVRPCCSWSRTLGLWLLGWRRSQGREGSIIHLKCLCTWAWALAFGPVMEAARADTCGPAHGSSSPRII